MTGRPITDADRRLIEDATSVLREHFEPGRHRTACALRTASGATYTSINLLTTIGAAQVHCEPIAVGTAITDGETEFETSVAVTYPDEDPAREPQVVSACGVCRELLRDFAPDIDVVVPGDGEPVKVPLPELLPTTGEDVPGKR